MVIVNISFKNSSIPIDMLCIDVTYIYNTITLHFYDKFGNDDFAHFDIIDIESFSIKKFY